MIADSSPDEAGRELAMWLVPPGLDETTAMQMLAETLDAVRDVAGAGDALVAALVGTVSSGMTGLEREVAAQATPLGPVLDRITGLLLVGLGLAVLWGQLA